MSQHHELDIRQWLIALSIRCSPRTNENLEMLAKDYASGLVDLPYEAFTPQSREAAARNWEHFPSYKSLRKFLETWIAKNAPIDTKLLPSIHDPNLTEEDQAHVRSWINLRANRKATGKFATGLDLLRRWPTAFAYVCRTDADAEDVARQRGWLSETEQPMDVSEVGIASNLIKLESITSEGGTELGAALASLGLSILRKQVEARAPERLHMLPDIIKPRPRMSQPRSHSVDAQINAVRDQPNGSGYDAAREEAARITAEFEVKHGRKPGELSPEQLDAQRAAAGIAAKPAPKPAPFTEAAEPESQPSPEPPSPDAKPILGLPWWMIDGKEEAA